MAYENIISILIKATDAASAVLDKTAANVEGTAARLNSVGTSMTSVGKTLTTGLTLPIIALGAASAKMAYDFQNKMELLHTNAGVAQSAIAGLSNQVLQMAGQVGQAPNKLAEGLYHIASAGNGIWNTSQMMNILKVAAEGANLGLANLDDTTYALTSALASNVKGAKNASEMMAVLNAIVGAGDMHMQDLNGAIGTGFLSTAATFGISIQSVGAALATLTDNGEHADAAATRLRMTWALMASPSHAASKQLEALGLTAENAKNATAGMNAVFAKSGLTTTTLADDLRKPNGITVAMKDLQTHLEKAGLSASETDAMLSKAFGGGRTDAALLTMLNNIGRMDDKFQAINHDTGTFQQKINDLNKTPMQQFRDAWAAIQADLTKLGMKILPDVASALKSLVGPLTAVTNWFGGLSPAWQKFVLLMAGSLAAGGPILLGLGIMAKSVSNIIALMERLGIVSETTVAANVAAGSSSMIASIGAIGLKATGVIGILFGLGSALNSAINELDEGFKKVQLFNGQLSVANQSAASLNANWTKINQQPNAAKLFAAPAGGFPTHALGTSFSMGGAAIVGEHGPELVNLPRGSQVLPAQQTKQMLGGNKSIVIEQFNVNNNVDADRIVRDIGWQLAMR